MHERDVINGLKQLTEAIFKPHFRHEPVTVAAPKDHPSNEVDTSATPTESSNLFSLVASSVMAKENQTDLDSILDVAMNEAEQFCAMVVQQLNANHDNDTDDDWHNGQLHAYSSASQRMFDTNTDGQSNAAHGNLRRQLNEF